MRPEADQGRDARLDDLPIPIDVQPTGRWTKQMLEMAAHIGPWRTLTFCDRFGGQDIAIPVEEPSPRIAAAIGDEGAAILQRIYGRETFSVPVARAALNEARRSGIINAIRAGRMTIGAAIPILGSSRTYISHLVNHPRSDDPLVLNGPKARYVDPRQIDLFGGEACNDVSTKEN